MAGICCKAQFGSRRWSTRLTCQGRQVWSPRRPLSTSSKAATTMPPALSYGPPRIVLPAHAANSYLANSFLSGTGGADG